MLTVFLKKGGIFLALTLLCHAAIAQTLPVERKAKVDEGKRTTVTPGKTRVKVKTETTGKVKWSDSTTIDDEKYGKVKLDMKSFQDKALSKTRELIHYITEIIDPKTSRENANNSIDQACLLFTDENAEVEISSIYKNKKATNETKKIRSYLTGLKMHSHFSSVVIDYANITYVPKFKKGVDGNYYSVITFVQKFQGYDKDNKPSYTDLTKKDVTIVLKSYEKADTEGNKKVEWDVFLSDIGVKETVQL